MSSLTAELAKLRRMLLTMSAVVEQRVGHALDGLLRHDLKKAEEVRAGDDEIDQFDVNVEAECVEILALHQPVAGDLRYVLAALRINADLERIADLARGIAKRAIKLESLPPLRRPEALHRMARAVRIMLADALRSLADQDGDIAAGVRRADRAVDELYRELFDWAVVEVAAHGDEAKAIIDTLSAVRALERIADISTNIAETVIFSVGGRIVRHAPIDG